MATSISTRPVGGWRTYEVIALSPILRAALESLHEHGYHGTTVRDIASRGAFTMPSLYYHHGSKEGVLVALLDVAMDDLELHVAGAQEASANPRERFANIVTAIALHSSRRSDLAQLHGEYRFLGSDARERYISRRTRIYRALLESITAGQVSGDFGQFDAPPTARAIVGMLQSIAEWYRADGPRSPEEIAEEYLVLALQIVKHRDDADAHSRPEDGLRT